MPFRFWLWPLPTSVVSAEAFQLALDWSAESCDPTTARTLDMLEPVSAIEPFTPCIPTCSFSPRAPIRKCRNAMSPQCVSILRGLHRLPDEETKSLAVSCRQTHRAAPCFADAVRTCWVRACLRV